MPARRTIQKRRARLRRAGPRRPAVRNGGECEEGRSEEREVAAGLASGNRFAVLGSQEPAPGVGGSSTSLNAGVGAEEPVALAVEKDVLAANRSSMGEEVKEGSLATNSATVPPAMITPMPRLARQTSAIFNPRTSRQRPSALAVARIAATKVQSQPSPLILENPQAARSPAVSSISNRISTDFSTAPLHLSVPAHDPAASLPSPPIPPDPMGTPCLATLPTPPCFDFKPLTSPNSCKPIARQFTSRESMGFDIARSEDPTHHVVRTLKGKIFWMAAEIAAANEKSTTRPVGNVLIPGPAKKPVKAKRKIDRTKLNRRSGEYVDSREDTEDESEEEGGEAEEWLGKEEGFWK